MKQLAKNGILNSMYNITNIIFPLIISIYVSRILLPDGVGKVSYVQNFASYFMLIAALGLPTYGIREIAKVKDNQSNKDKVFTELLIINTVSTIITTVVYTIIVFSNTAYKSDILLYVIFGFQIFMNLFNIDWFYQGTEDYGYIAKRNIIIKFISLISIFIFVKSRNDYIYYATITVLALTLNYIFNIIHCRSLVKISFDNISLKKHIRPLIVLGLFVFLNDLYTKIDITMLGKMSSEYNTGIYATSQKIISILRTLCASLSSVFLPQLTYYYQKDKNEFYKIISYGERILSFITIPAIIGLFIIAPKIVVLLFGDAFSAVSTTLRIMEAIIFIGSFGDLLCNQLVIATGNENKQIFAYLAAAIANIVLNAVLIPTYKENGAAVASVVSELIVKGVQFIAMFKLLKLKFDFKSFFEAILSSAVMAIFVIIFSRIISNNFVCVFVSVVGGAIIYFLMNILIKNTTATEIINFAKAKIKTLKNN